MATGKSEKSGEVSRGSDAFARDLGYLFPFLDRLAAHAASVTGSEGDRLRELVEGERDRWEQIRALLSAEAGDATVDVERVDVEPELELAGQAESSAAPPVSTPSTRVETRPAVTAASSPSTPPSSTPSPAESPALRAPIGRHFTVGPLKPARSGGKRT